MRIGAMFARGSCRALKWMGLFGVVFALGGGSAAAQLAAVDSDFTIAVDDVTEGEAARITVTLHASVNANVNTATAVTVSVSVINRQDGPNTQAENGDRTFNGADTFMLTFPANETANATDKMTKSGSVLLQTLHDIDAENEDLTIDATLAGGGVNPNAEEKNIVIEDDEVQTYVLALSPASQKAKEGDMVTVSLKAEPSHVQGSELLTLHLDQTPPFAIAIEQGGGPVQGSSVTIGGEQDNSTATITITTNGNDKNRADDTIALSAYSGTAGDSEVVDRLEITLADIDKLPAVTATAIVLDEEGDPVDPQPDMVESIMEGQTIDLKITVVDEDGTATAAGEALMVSLMPTGDANEQDYRLSMHPVAIASGSESATTQLTASEDQDVGMEMLMLDAEVAGEAAKGTETSMSEGILSLVIMDTTMKQVEALPDEMIREIIYAAKEAGAGDDGKFSPGETIEIDASMLFTAAEGYGLTYSADSDNTAAAPASASGNAVTVMAQEPAEMVHLTITATASPVASGAKALPQTSPNVAQVIFPVDVELADLAVTLSGPEDMNIAEGMSAMITATANRPVTDDTLIELIQTDGTAAPVDYMAGPLMIMAGEMTGAAILTAVEDDTMEEGETLTLEGRVGNMKTNTLVFYIWDAAVSALPLIAQLLLAAFLAIGGYRRYLRR